MDVETFHDGIVAAVLVVVGDSSPVGGPIALLAESEEDVQAALAKAQDLQGSTPVGPSTIQRCHVAASSSAHGCSCADGSRHEGHCHARTFVLYFMSVRLAALLACNGGRGYLIK
ncbi:hypothetical protein GUJ93_ZPchr0002g24301 [Zizania palustris]|uniref:Uncharacterized protein n=1 Tax=Zizania palustris TaxID=103762 RepID=A0A8J5VQQ5_ZIZPA|nr:hypothetical protein GUJ93_ZPchr0002g24301 [Zizania palustris]